MSLPPAPARRPLPTWSFLVLVLALALGVARIVSTYDVFNETFDEGVHVAAGMELLDRGTFTYEPKHPPLARVMVAMGPYLGGIRSQGKGYIWEEGRAILHATDHPQRTLFLARLGVLPFFLLAAFLVWGWARRLAGDGAAGVAVLLFTCTPIVLAHSSVATTDMGLAATLLGALWATMLWVEDPSPRHSMWLGIAGAATLTAKLSSVAFLGLSVLLVIGLRWWWRDRSSAPEAGVAGRVAGGLTVTVVHLRRLPLVGVVAFVFVWALYRFQVGHLHGVPVPLTTMLQGVKDLATHNDLGHASYLLGDVYVNGKLLFFPVGLLVKSPLTLLALGSTGAVLLARRAHAARDWQLAVPLLAMLAVLAVSMPARINIGVRHILPVFALLAVCGGVAAAVAWERWRQAGARGALVLASAAGLWSTARIHPDYLAYFNELAGSHPERVLVDSDLDWGQDLNRLRDTLAAHQVDSVTVAYFGSAFPEQYGIPVKALWKRDMEVHGWFAVSQTLHMRGDAVLRNSEWALWPDALRWVDRYEPVARVGKSILLYNIP